MMEPSRIQDIPSLKQTLDDIHSLDRFKRVFPVLKPILRLLRIRVDDVDAALAQLGPLSEGMQALATLPDRFNRLFAQRGWIMYDTMDADVAQVVIARAEGGDIDGAEQALVDYYDEPTVRLGLRRMRAVRAFQPRMPLAELALVDYIARRYHACVPVTLALLDGMVNELGSHGFFTEGVNLEAWDSIAAHSTGLAVLSKQLGACRHRTTTDPIALPYRHGILHGLDLNYASQMVAAKAWAALFAAREWALKAEHKQLAQPPAQARPTWSDILHQLRARADDRARRESWVARTIRPGDDIPVTGIPEDYADGSPEQRLAEFLNGWQARNYGSMACCAPWDALPANHSLNGTAGKLRAHYATKRLTAFTLVDVRDEAPAVTTITVKLVYDDEAAQQERTIGFRLVYQDSAGNPAVRGQPSGTWKILGYLV